MLASKRGQLAMFSTPFSSGRGFCTVRVAKAITYFENQGPRMDYPSYVEQGLQIGSGSAESAVNRVVGVRINQAGMRWDTERAEAVAHVRAAILSNRWDDFWTIFSPTPRQYLRKELPLAA